MADSQSANLQSFDCAVPKPKQVTTLDVLSLWLAGLLLRVSGALLALIVAINSVVRWHQECAGTLIDRCDK